MVRGVSSTSQNSSPLTAQVKPAGALPAQTAAASGDDHTTLSPPDESSAASLPNFSSWAAELSTSDLPPTASVGERRSISTAYVAPAETREATAHELVLSKSDMGQAQSALHQELGHQQQARGEGQRRADQAQGALDQLQGSQTALERERGETEDQKRASRVFGEDSDKRVKAGEQHLRDDAAQVESLKSRGDELASAKAETDGQSAQLESDLGQAQEDAQQARQASQAAQEQQQQAAQQKAEGPPGQSGKAPAAQAPPAQKKAAPQPKPVQPQQAAQRAQSAEQAAQQRQKMLEQKQEQLKRVSESQRQNLEQTRERLEGVQAGRRQGASALQDQRNHLQQGADTVRDLSGKTDSIQRQLDELKGSFGLASKSRKANLDNVGAADRNLEQLKQVRGRVERSGGLGAPDARSLGTAQSSNGNSLADAAAAPRANANSLAHETNDSLILNLGALGDGLGAGQGDASQALGRSQGYAGDADRLADAQLAAVAAASGSAGSSTPDTGATVSSGGGPGNSDFGHSHGKKGK